MAESVQLPLTGLGDATTEVAVSDRPDGSVVQLFKEDLADPQSSLLLAAALAPGVNIDLDASVIDPTKLGQLIAADIGSSVPLRVDIQTVAGARTTRTTVYTGLEGSKFWKTPAAAMHELAGGGGNKFGVSVTNLSVFQTADARITLYWDEVNP